MNRAVGQATKLNTATREANIEYAAREASLPAPNPFVTKGVSFDESMINTDPVVKAIYGDYLRAVGGDVQKAGQLTETAVRSGTTLPTPRIISANEELVRLIPVGNNISISSFYMRRTQYDMLIGQGKNAQQVADALGLPASSYAGGGFRGFQALSIEPQPGRLATAYESVIAPAQQGTYQATGGLRQLIVPNAKDFTAPKLIPGGFIPATRGR